MIKFNDYEKYGYKYLYNQGLREDLSLAYTAFLKAVDHFDESRGSFITCYKQWLRDAVTKHRITPIGVLACEEADPIIWDSDRHPGDDNDIVTEPKISTLEADVINSMYKEQLMKKMTDVEKEIITMRLEGYTDKEIGDTIGITAQGVRYKLYMMRRRIKR